MFPFLTFPRSSLQDESLTFQGQLDSFEAEILKQRDELHNLQVMNNDAHLSKDAAKVLGKLFGYEIYIMRVSAERLRTRDGPLNISKN